MTTPIEFPNVNLKQHKWNVLSQLWLRVGSSTLTFECKSDGWYINESLFGSPCYQLRRDYVSLQRYTNFDNYGLLGLSMIDFNSREFIITEGVSDFFTTKLLCPSSNVLGVTNLGGSCFAKSFLVSSTSKVKIIADNDPTGRLNACKWKELLTSHQISTSIFLPDSKDITDQFLEHLSFNSSVYF